MRITLLSICTLAVALAQELCTSTDPLSEAFDAVRKIQAGKRVRGLSSTRNETLLISTYVHIVEREQDAGLVTDTILNDQVLNESYAPHSIQFILKDVSRTINDEWASATRQKEKQETLRRGHYDEPNLYFESDVGIEVGCVTGLCEFPVEDPINTGMNGTSWAVWDGCHVGAGTIPGGVGTPGSPDDNQGKTAVHEVGHWLGLFHVFQGDDCNGEGDLINDTPVMLAISLGACDIGQDSCPDHEGLNPIYNYIDYSSDPY